MAINAPIQGTSADFTRIAMVRIYKHLKKEELLHDVRMMLQVHDELVFEIKENMVNEMVPTLKKVMEGVLKRKEMSGVPILVVIKVGDNWEDLKLWNG